MEEVLLLITTESDEKKAKHICRLLIQKQLAACVSMKPIVSFFKWDNLIDEINEFEITIKSKPELKDNLISFLKKTLSYEVPQIIYRKFHADIRYLDWIAETI